MKKTFLRIASIMLFAAMPGMLLGQNQEIVGQIGSTSNQSIKLIELDSKRNHEIPVLKFQAPNVEALLAEDEGRDKNGYFYRYGHGMAVNITPQNSGIWTTRANGDKVWQVNIQSKGALALNFVFDKFHLYDNSYINVYNKNGEKVHQTYTAKNTLNHGQNNLSLCRGDDLIIELVEPKGSRASELHMDQLFYAYRGVNEEGNFLKHGVGWGNSESCQVNVNCSPAGDEWQDEKKGVAKILMIQGWSAGLCTGSLVNNTAQDCKPYFLTAMHCAEGVTPSQMNNWRFYFNYESSGCSTPSNENQIPEQYITGCVRLAGSDDVSGQSISKSDFFLVRLGTESTEASVISELKSFGAYWNGWDRANTAVNKGAGIHHPSGDIKKISHFNTMLQTTGYNGSPANAHWYLTWSNTGNGQGVTEGGSSGSPLFNYNNGNSRIIGTLSGGSSYCSAPNSPDLYGKMSSHWTSAGTGSNKQLKPWLDPGNTGAMTVDGSYDPCAGGGTNPDPDPDPDPEPGDEGCTPTIGQCDEYIAKVTLNTIDNATGCDLYIDYSNISTTLTAGQQYPLGIVPGVLGNGAGVYYTGDVIGAWVDWNNDGVFNGPNETIGTVALTNNYSGGFMLTVPSNVAPGTYRLRVRIDYDPSQSGNISPCNDSNYGEVEDYRIVIQGNGNGNGDDNGGDTETQYDLEVKLQTPASGSVQTAKANQGVKFTITNNGPDAVAPGKVIYLSYLHVDGAGNETIYSLTDGSVNSVNGIQLTQGLAVGQTITAQQIEGVSGGAITINTSSFVNGDLVAVYCLGAGDDANDLINGDPNDTNYNNNTDFFVIGGSVGIDEETLSSITLYPNPTSNQVFIDMNDVYQEVNVMVYDLAGQIVATSSYTNAAEITLDFGYLANGIYQVAIKTNLGQIVKKVVKQ